VVEMMEASCGREGGIAGVVARREKGRKV